MFLKCINFGTAAFLIGGGVTNRMIFPTLAGIGYAVMAVILWRLDHQRKSRESRTPPRYLHVS